MNESLEIRRAREADVEAVVGVYAGDETGGHGDGWGPERAPGYIAAFRAIDANPNAELYVVTAGGAVVGTFLLNIVTGLVGGGVSHCLLQSVSIAPDWRGRGLGRRILAWVEDRARARGCKDVQLVSNKRRVDAHRFYETNGYLRSHEGFKKLV